VTSSSVVGAYRIVDVDMGFDFGRNHHIVGMMADSRVADPIDLDLDLVADKGIAGLDHGPLGLDLDRVKERWH
jgi:hypothetical protein